MNENIRLEYGNDTSKQIALIIPILNEADNIVRLINAYLSLPYNIKIVVADSDSPDGTGTLVKQEFGRDDRVILINASNERGRGASVVYAYRWIINNILPVFAVAVSDADFSHDPDDFHKMVKALEEADVVIGSRYASKSKIVGWPFSRRVFSFCANSLAGILLPVKVSDFTNGYRLFRIKMLYVLDLDKIDADGYIHLSQELLQWHSFGAKIVEVPTTFVNRVRGNSNLRIKLVVESLLVIFKLAWQYRRGKIFHKT